jgi:hypothetical protein
MKEGSIDGERKTGPGIARYRLESLPALGRDTDSSLLAMGSD